MQKSDSPLYVYRIDSQDRIQFVNPAWISFAEENEAPELVANSLLGNSIWEYIQGQEAQLLYKHLFGKLRQRNQEIVIPFRCDSPTKTRHMELVLRSETGGMIELEGRLLAQHPRAPVHLLDPGVKRMSGKIAICSICRKVEIKMNQWVEIDSAITRQRLFTKGSLPRLEEQVCPACKRIMTDAAK
jgi:hypothetical protein